MWQRLIVVDGLSLIDSVGFTSRKVTSVGDYRVLQCIYRFANVRLLLACQCEANCLLQYSLATHPLAVCLTLGVHAQRGLLQLSFVSVSLYDISLHEPSITPQTIPCIQRRIKVEKYVGFSLKLLHSRVNGVKHSEKANMLILYNKLTSSGSACSVYLEGTRCHSEGCVSTPTCYLLLQLALYQTLRELYVLSGRLLKHILIAQPINQLYGTRTVRRGFALQCFFICIITAYYVLVLRFCLCTGIGYTTLNGCVG